MTQLLYSRYWQPMSRVMAVLILAIFLGSVWYWKNRLTGFHDDMVRWAVAFVIVQVTILVGLTVGLLGAKTAHIVRERKRTWRMERLGRMLGEFVAGEAARPLEQAARSWPAEFAVTVEQSLDLLRGTARERVERLLMTTAAYGNALRATRDSNPATALQALVLLSKLPHAESQLAVEEARRHPEPMVRAAARRLLLARGGSERTRLFDELPRLDYWEKLVLFHQIPHGDPLLEEFLGRALRSTHDETVLVALECIIGRQRGLLVQAEPWLAMSCNVEIRIKFFKALPYLQPSGPPGPLIAEGLRDPDWRVRAMAARSAGHYRVEELAPELLRLVGESTEPVETAHAARALAAIGGEPFQRLSGLVSSPSRLIRNTVTEVIERKFLTEARGS